MTYDAAKKFWKDYLKLSNSKQSRITMTNPGNIFAAEDKAGKYDDMPEEEFKAKMEDINDISAFWHNAYSETVQNILTNALAAIDLSDIEIDLIAETLAVASTRTNCYYAGEISESPDDIVNTDLDFDPAGPPYSAAKWTPHDIYNYLEQHIYGQEEAKRAVSMLMYNHLHGRRRNIVMAGNSGCGKTETWRALSKVYSCIRIINGPQLSCDGWKGSYKISDIFKDEPKQIAERLIIVIDEADKMLEPQIGSSMTDHAKMLQNEMLHLMDGDTLTFVSEKDRNEKTVIDCSRISVVFCGSFETMRQAKAESSGGIGFGKQEKAENATAEFTEEDLVQYANVRREIAGRINRIVKLDALDADDFEAIMESPASPIRKIEESHQVSLSVDKDTRRKLAADAEKSKLGCRYIRSQLQNMLDERMFDKPDAGQYELSLD